MVEQRLFRHSEVAFRMFRGNETLIAKIDMNTLPSDPFRKLGRGEQTVELTRRTSTGKRHMKEPVLGNGLLI